jgi:hypothetical protein
MAAKIPIFTPHEDGIVPFGITPQTLTQVPTNLPWSRQISPMDLNPNLNYIIKQEHVENEHLDDFPPPFLAALRAQIDSRLEEENTFHDEEKSSGTASTDDENPPEITKFSSKTFKSVAENSIRRPKISRIQKTRRPKIRKTSTLRVKPYTRRAFNADIGAELKPQLALLDLHETTNADVIRHMSEKFPIYAEHGEFTSGWVTKAKYGNILSAVTGRLPMRLRDRCVTRSRPSNAAAKTADLTDELFLSIMETVHDFDSVSAAARHYNVNRSSLTRRLEKAQHAAYVKELRSKVESSKNKAIKEEAEEADTDSIDEVLLIR